MIAAVENLIVVYAEWLKQQTQLREVGHFVEITTPFLDRHNDQIQIYARRDNGSFVLTDDGYTIHDLKMSGCTLDTKRRKDLLHATLNGFGVQVQEEALTTRATEANFAIRKHSLVQAMLAVNDMFFTASPVVTSLFEEDVIAWMEADDVRFLPNVKFTGKSGYDHVFDFAIPKSKKSPERIVQAINRPTRETAEVFAFAWLDTREVRPADSQAIAILNDTERSIPQGILSALKSYDVTAVPWSRRDEVAEKLAA